MLDIDKIAIDKENAVSRLRLEKAEKKKKKREYRINTIIAKMKPRIETWLTDKNSAAFVYSVGWFDDADDAVDSAKCVCLMYQGEKNKLTFKLTSTPGFADYWYYIEFSF